jgi:hypothetical protein
MVFLVLPNCNNIAAQESRSIFALKQCLQPGVARFCSSGVKGGKLSNCEESYRGRLGEAEGLLLCCYRVKPDIIFSTSNAASACKITPLEWSTGMYKHLDHHLKQFGV